QIDGVISKDFKAESGKHNLMSSLNLWLTDIVRGGQLDQAELTPDHDFYWAFNSALAPLKMPAVAVQEIGLFDVGKRAFDGNLVGFTEDGEPIRAVQNQTLVEINCWAQDSDTFGGATKKVYELRDRLVYALEFAGTMTRKDDAFIIPPIKLRDFSKEDKPVIGIIRIDPNGNAINEKFLIDPVTNQLKNYKLLVRFLYDECKNPL
ncbi:MAG: hypothetical protein ABL876_18740, partial [Chitinophagaceae bacterium]